jgi:thiamine pyrophosphate-dependent acetolactate synthase large subunit-like protein
MDDYRKRAIVVTRMGSSQDQKNFPDLCLKCKGTVAVEVEVPSNKNKSREKNEEAVRALKAHAEFLTTQIVSVKHNPDLKAVFKRMLQDCKVQAYDKMRELAKNFQNMKANEEPHSKSFEKRLDQTQEVVDLLGELVKNQTSLVKDYELKFRRIQWTTVHVQLKELRKAHEETTKEKFEGVANKLEEIRNQVVTLLRKVDED